MDLVHLEAHFERARRAVVGVVIESEDAGQPIFLGSGVLVLLGGREFVLTAGHNVWSARSGRPLQIAIGTPYSNVASLIHPGNGTAGRVYYPVPDAGQDPEPDVAAVEVTEKAVLLPPTERRPFIESEITDFDPNGVQAPSEAGVRGRELVVIGFPSRLAKFEPGLATDARIGTRGSLTIGMTPLRVSTIPSVAPKPRFAHEPVGGRGMHLYLSRTLEDGAGNIMRLASPSGLSGGPVIAATGDGALVGLMRGAIEFEDGWDEWCEPAAEAVRLLLEHEDSEVAAAAERVWSNYSESARKRRAAADAKA